MKLISTAFNKDQPIPIQFTCDGKDLSPPMVWSEISPKARSLALIADDPDAPAGTWVHWVLYNIPVNETSLPEGVPPLLELSNGTRQGINDFQKVGYNGPCPPPGKPHRYFFKLFALDAGLELPEMVTKQQLLEAMKSRVVGEVHLVGTYQRAARKD